MAIRRRRRYQRWKRLRRRQEDPETTRHYTPQDEAALIMEKGNGAGILRSTSKDLRVKNGLQSLGEGDQTGHPHRVMLVIVTLSLAFIAIIAYFVAQMPVKP